MSGPILAGARKRECTRTAKIGPDLRLVQVIFVLVHGVIVLVHGVGLRSSF